MSERTRRVVVAGCGTIAELNHLPALRALQAEQVEVVGLVDPGDARLNVCRPLAPRAQTFHRLDEALAALAPDLVVIASPPQFHKDQALQSFRAGAHVLCEKPLAVRSADCHEMIDEAARANRLLGVGLMRRFYPSVQAVGSLIREGVLGAPHSFTVLEGFPFGWPVKSAHPFERDGGGLLFDAGPHLVDLLQFWFGPLGLVDYADDAAGGVEANCAIELEASGVRGSVRLTREIMLANRFVIQLEKGWISYHYDVIDQFFWGWHGSPHANRVVLADSPSDRPMWDYADPARKVAGKIASYFVAQHRNMIGATRGAASLVVTAAEATAGIALLEQCRSSRRLIDMPWLDEAEWAEARRFQQEAQS